MTSQKIPVSPALQRLGEEFQAMYGAQLEARGALRAAAASLFAVLGARKFAVDDETRRQIERCTDPDVLRR